MDQVTFGLAVVTFRVGTLFFPSDVFWEELHQRGPV